MSYIEVVNNSSLPIHGSLSWATIQQQHFNDLPPGQSHDFVVGVGWHDLHVVVGSPEARFPDSDNNPLQIAEFAVGVAGVVTAIAGIVLVPFSGGASAALVAVGWGMAVGGGIIAAGDIAIVATSYVFEPVTIKGLYAPDGYTVTVTGGEIIGTHDPQKNRLTVTEIKPLNVSWENRTSHTHGVEVAAG